MAGISVCIPARNEEKGIEGAIHSALRQSYNGPTEVLVCANACTDRTQQIVYDISRKEGRVSLLTSDPGKPNAWNNLIKTSNHDKVVFIDGDVQISPSTLAALETCMESNPEYMAATGMQVKIMDGFDLASRILNMPSKASSRGGLPGILYMLDKPRFQERMEEAGYSQMPSDIINEDHWITLVLTDEGEGQSECRHVGYTPNAQVYFIPPKIDEFREYVKRVERGKVQLAREHPNLSARNRPSIKGGVGARLPNLLKKWQDMDGGIEKLATPATYLMRRALWRRYEQEGRETYANGERSNVWRQIEGTKRGFVLKPTRH